VDIIRYVSPVGSIGPAGPQVVIVSTGTGLVPELSFTLLPGDEVRIGIDGVGTLTNTVRLATADGFGWLTPEPGHAPR
jgi:2-dehydro-3-deoxy-D-arabinonate dehydratase